jgi:hypothetical protein
MAGMIAFYETGSGDSEWFFTERGSKMSAVIAIRGQESVKSVNGARRRVVPFVGTDREGWCSQMGVGYILPDEGSVVSIWGLAVPHLLMQSWHGMKLFEQLEYVASDTLCDCWYAAGRNMHEGINNRHFQRIAPQFGGSKELWAVCNEVLALAPDIGDIEAAVRTLDGKGVEIDTNELHRELLIKGIRPQGFIETIIYEGLEAENKRAASRQHVVLPDPPKKSFIERLRSMF